MARTFNGTSHYIEATSAVVSAVPITMACWFLPNNVTSSYVLIGISEFASLARHQLAVSGAVAGDPVRVASVNSAGTSGVAATSTGYTAGVWHHACGVWASDSSRSVYLNGGGDGTDTTAVSPASLNRTAIGAGRFASTTNTPFAGSIARVGIWSVALSSDEIASLAKGFCPCMIRPQALIFFVPLLGAAQDLRGGITLTDTGTTVADHPRIILPS